MIRTFALMIALAGALTCIHPRAEVVDYCVEHPGECDPCDADDLCVFSGNSCTDTVFCAHEAAEIAVIDIGCSKALERRWPDDDACVCREQVCQSEE